MDEQQRAALERERPVDLARFTWAAWIDWLLAVVVVVALIPVAVLLFENGAAVLFGLVLVSGMYLVGWWRAQRLSQGLRVIEQDAGHGRFSAVTRLRSGSYFQFVWSARQTATLSVDDGWVELGVERWPAASVTLGQPPSWWMNRGIELQTPSGPRFVTCTRAGDPAIYLAAMLDRRLRDAFGRALAGQRGGMASALNAPGWYPDPAGSPAWRWWDGQQWGPLSN